MGQAENTTIRDYRRESEMIISRIKNDSQFARAFFFGSGRQSVPNISGLRSKLISKIRKDYGVVVSADDFNTILYEHLWDEGTWRALDTFDFRSSFFQWLSTVASRCLMAYLEENGYIHISRRRTPATTRLVLRSKSPEYCKEVIDAMVSIKPLNDFLTALYVTRLEPEQICESLGLDEQMYKLTRRAAETALKLALLNTSNNYGNVLSDKQKKREQLSFDELETLKSKLRVEDQENPLSCLIKAQPGTEQFDLEVVAFLYDFSEKLFKDPIDRTVWQERFIREQSPVKLAEQLGRTRGWVDTRYSRLKAIFRSAVRKEWEKETYGKKTKNS